MRAFWELQRIDKNKFVHMLQEKNCIRVPRRNELKKCFDFFELLFRILTRV